MTEESGTDGRYQLVYASRVGRSMRFSRKSAFWWGGRESITRWGKTRRGGEVVKNVGPTIQEQGAKGRGAAGNREGVNGGGLRQQKTEPENRLGTHIG